MTTSVRVTRGSTGDTIKVKETAHEVAIAVRDTIGGFVLLTSADGKQVGYRPDAIKYFTED